MNMAIELEEEGKSLADYIKIFKRRKKQMLLPGAIVFVIALLVALLWPPTYQSSATILIEQQQIPEDLVQSTVSSYADQQIEVIKARIMTVKNIMGLITKYHVYTEDEIKTTAITDLVQDFIDDTDIENISASIVDPKTGRPTEATIAFTLSFENSDPDTAMKVTNELVNLFLNENLQDRTEKSAAASSFLKQQVDALSKDLRRQEKELADFKEKNDGSLPELYEYNLQVLDRTQNDLLDASSRLKELEKRKFDLESRLAQLSPYAPTTLPDGKAALSDHDRLKALKSEYLQKSAIYSQDYPDVVSLKRQIATLEKQLGKTMSPREEEDQLRIERDKLAKLREKYKPDHPKVIAQLRVVQELEKEVPKISDKKFTDDTDADNPAYVLLDAQLKSVLVDLKVLKDNKADLEKKLDHYEKLIQRSPMVEKKYRAMLRDYDNATDKYKDLKAKQMAADLGQNLEQERKGERFTLIDPPQMPQDPVSPNRIAIILVGLVLAICAGAGYIMILEVLSPAVRGRAALVALTGVQPLAVVPYMTIDEEALKENKKWIKFVVIAGICLIVALVAFNYLVKPLDVTWYLLLRKLGLS